MLRRTWVSILFLILLLIDSGQVAAQEGVVKWGRYDVNLNIQQNSGVTVEEIHEVSLVGGVTSFSRIIPTDKLEGISNVSVLQIDPNGAQRSYQLADTGAEYTFQIISEKNQQTVQLYFPPNNVSSTQFILKYFVVGTIRFYDEGDRFEWQPFGRRAAAPIDSSRTVVSLPGQFAETQVVRSSTGFDQVNSFFSDGNKVSFATANVPAGSQLELSVAFPHGAVQGSPPHWQQEADSLEFWTPILQWGSVIFGLLFLFLGPLAVFAWWYMRVRVSPGTGKAPKYLKSPPGDLSPAVAGALLDGKATPRHIFAILLDIAYRGALNVDQAKQDSDSLLPEDEVESTFNLYAVDQEKAARPYEASLYGKIFGYTGAKKRQLLDIRRTLFMSVPELKNQIDLEIAQAGYFSEDISAARRQYAAFGGAGILMSIVLGLLMAVILGSKFTYLVVCPFLGIATGAAALLVVGFAVPKRTEAGAKVAVRWEAFRRYLKDMGVKDAAKVKPRFAQLLPYAVAFGVGQEFVEKFAAADVSTPKWWGKPEERGPDLDHGQAHAWVSAGYTQDRPAQPASEKPKTKSSIRRLGESAKDVPQGTLLKHIKSSLLAFLDAGHEVFAKAPPLDEDEEVDFQTLEQQ